MGELAKFKNEIFLYAFVIMGICELVSIPFIGFDRRFLFGLVLGTCISIVNFNILMLSSMLVISRKKPALAWLSYILRLCIYGFAFYTSIKISTAAGMGSIIGFITIKIAIYYIHGFKAKFSKDRKVPPEVLEQYEQLDKEREEKRKRREL